ncbi:hypothetical protein [Marinobacter sp. HL-58]|uniref:hypothetical protein n=1 Tax=Marinobacter sp. HL-58 TaxID=1479237 RepID=UPI000488D57E|nr:hypothetical protein [Marinobacter sp. HL-58]KPP98894.1 MAG: hypothetical protein HLUCCO03_13755 [Marinobacter sp. HL-58]
MTWLNWLPWRYVLRYMAQKHGFLDPVALLSRLHRFAQPSEVAEPIELLRAGVVFHARGLINSRVIQHNLDWVWPYWIERQFNPRDPSFIPRAFSITHINLSHRNWTAIGYPDCPELPIVDPRGLLTPFLDGWSLDIWLISDDGNCLIPSRATDSQQHQQQDGDTLYIDTITKHENLQLRTRASVTLRNGKPVCRLRILASADRSGWIVASLRPQNPEGISFIHQLTLGPAGDFWLVDQTRKVEFSEPASRHHISNYRNGDVYIHLLDRKQQIQGICDVGMVTAAAMFPLTADEQKEVTLTVPLDDERTEPLPAEAWPIIDKKRCRLECPDRQYQSLYDAAITSLVLHSPGDVFPGPYTYRRFWFRDAAFIIHALLCAGLTDRAERALEKFPPRQSRNGFFLSQDGEWDSNGEVLWILKRYFDMTNTAPSARWLKVIRNGARWIMQKRLTDNSDSAHAGLLPAGFSAEHLGPNDYYYWDDFWSVAGLRAAARMVGHTDPRSVREFSDAADSLSTAIDRSLSLCEQQLQRPAMPASPYRRMDAGAIGSLVASYPTQQVTAHDYRLQDSLEFLLRNCFVNGAFYQDMIHSGLNAYLTLHVAQVLLRAGDPRYLALMDTVASMASSTGQWPEAIHPLTGGGCMGDGHHVWASAEWVLMLRNCFLREEGEQLILCSGIPGRWLDQEAPIHFGPAPTTFGTVNVSIKPDPTGQPLIEWQGIWHHQPPDIVVALPGYHAVNPDAGQCAVRPDRRRATS